MSQVPKDLADRIKALYPNGQRLMYRLALEHRETTDTVEEYYEWLLNGTQPYSSRPKSDGLDDVIDWIWNSVAMEDPENLEAYVEDLES